MEEHLTHQVRDALANLYDPIHLQNHPLLKLLTISHKAGETAGEALRRALWEAIEALRPPAEIPVARPEWLNYRLLWLYYVQAVNQEGVCQQLGLSERSFYRRQKEAIEAVASVLRTRCSPKGPGAAAATVDSEEASREQARERALRLACRFNHTLVDLGALLAEVRETLAPLLRRLGLVLEIELPSAPAMLYSDPAALRQILLNLLAEAAPLAAGDTLRLSFAVEGAEFRGQIAGLRSVEGPLQEIEQREGILVCHRLLEACGGRLWLQRDACRALTIHLAFPSVRPGLIAAIDDDDETVALYRRYLEPHGYIVQESQAEAWLGQDLPATLPDLILLDVLMPRHDGWTLLKRLKNRAETSRIPVVICSVLSQPHLALALGAAEVLQKPIAQETLLQTVQRLLAREDNRGAAPPTAPASI